MKEGIRIVCGVCVYVCVCVRGEGREREGEEKECEWVESRGKGVTNLILMHISRYV